MDNAPAVVAPVKRAKLTRITRKNKEGQVTATFDYAKVSSRVAEFNNLHKNGSIRTSYVHQDGYTMFRAMVIPDVDTMERYFEGTSLGKLGSEKALEKLETIAVGRALAFAGFLSDGEIASNEEMDKYEETISLIDDSEVMEATVSLESAHDLDELGKIWRSFSQARRDNPELLNLKNKLKAKYENTSSGATQSGVARSTQGKDNGNGSAEDSRE